LDVLGRAEAVEMEIIATNGAQRWLRVQHGPGLDESGKVSFDVLVITDITRQREVDRLKDDFFSTVSHELRTPLTPIKGYATLLLRRGDDIPFDRRKEALQSIVERSDHMARLVEDLLIASRLANTSERRLPEVNRQPLEITAVVERSLRSFRTSHPLREFRLERTGDLTVVGDNIRIEQVVANLVSNAVKFSDEGTPVEVFVDAEGHSARLRVVDYGRGIPSDRFAEIFEKFRRLEDPLVMETGGAGLGLFIVKQLVSAMGGSVTVDSVVGEGSVFTVTFPLVGGAAGVAPAHRRMTDLAG
ncbi:MAG TPA: HAMP domain-containing sensor histidine kinase, partial [Actinomycetota bacterium]|nr:HAMP domain-containing sensor histidine kinase [Actinomycetota bacterium]